MGLAAGSENSPSATISRSTASFTQQAARPGFTLYPAPLELHCDTGEIVSARMPTLPMRSLMPCAHEEDPDFSAFEFERDSGANGARLPSGFPVPFLFLPITLPALWSDRFQSLCLVVGGQNMTCRNDGRDSSALLVLPGAEPQSLLLFRRSGSVLTIL